MKHTLTLDEIDATGRILADVQANLASRFRALFTLRNVSGDQSISWISKTLLEDQSPLLKHECAFCLGQMQDPLANQVLEQVLGNMDEHCMVRHEAGEALAAIGTPSSLEILRKYSTDPVIEVAQTCQLGVKRIEFESLNGKSTCSPFNSVDPTPALDVDSIDVEKLGKILADPSQDLYDRYRAMFSLRNLRTDESVKALGRALIKYQNDKQNNLLKHEIAYVFGQLQDERSIEFLKQVLSNHEEHEMVRHEVAEALGSIAGEEAADILNCFKSDSVQVVKDSIEVALDMNEYEKSQEFNFLETKNGKQ